MERDLKSARAFAVKWSTKSRGEIANLGGAYLQVDQALLEMLQIWYCPIDDPGCAACFRVRAIRKMLGLPEEKEPGT